MMDEPTWEVFREDMPPQTSSDKEKSAPDQRTSNLSSYSITPSGYRFKIKVVSLLVSGTVMMPIVQV